MKDRLKTALRFIRRNRVMTRLLSFILTLVLVFYVIPSTIYVKAQELLDNGTAIDEVTTKDIISSSVYEIEELRESHSKHFRLEDGTFVVAKYNDNVHYLDENGKWKDIDNTVSSSLVGYTIPSSEVTFSKKTTGNGKLYTFDDGKNKITLSLQDANKGVEATVINGSDSEDMTESQKAMNLEKLASRVIYYDILESTDIEYILHGTDLKENIIVKDRRDIYDYVFELKLKGLVAALDEKGNVIISDEDTSETMYIIPSPVVYDSLGQVPDEGLAYYSLSNKGNKYTLKVSVDSNWMNSEDRIYPVIIDPTVSSPDEFAVEDTSYGGSEYGDDVLLYVKYNSDIFWKITNLPTLPDSSYVTNVLLMLPYHSSSGRFMPDMRLRRVESAWSESEGTAGVVISDEVESIASIEEAISGLTYVFDITELFTSWYQDPTTNHGVAIGYYNLLGQALGLTGITTRLCSSEATGENVYMTYPSMEISYANTSGIESYYSYLSQSAGYGGIGSVNLATGSLNWQIPTLTTTAPLMSYTPALIYNSYLSGLDYTCYNADTAFDNAFMPLGFKLNLNETIIQKTYYTDEGYDRKSYYSYDDSDGTRHILSASETEENTYCDTDGLKMKFVVSTDSIVLTDDSNITKTFTKVDSDTYPYVESAWCLSEISDMYGNKLVVTLDSPTRPSKLSLKPAGASEAIDLLTFVYNSDGRLISIYNPTTMDAVLLRYSAEYNGNIVTSGGKYLRKIEHLVGVHNQDNTTSLSDLILYYNSQTNTDKISVVSSSGYVYSSDGRLIKIVDDISGKYLSYLWNNGRIEKIREGSGNTFGQTLCLDYISSSTSVRSSGNDDIINNEDDVITRYVFDDKARAVSVYSTSVYGTEIYGASSGSYDDSIENNSLKHKAVIGDYSVNYILNGDFEEFDSDGKFLHWTQNERVISGTAYPENDEGYNSAKFDPYTTTDASLSQVVFLPAGTYSLSMIYLSRRCETYEGTVSVTSTSGSGLNHVEKLSLNKDLNQIQKTSFATTFEVANYVDGGDYVEVKIFLTRSEVIKSQMFHLDNVMLCNTSGAADYSMVSHGNFEANSLGSGNTAISPDYYWSFADSDASPTITQSGINMFKDVLTIEKESTNTIVKQRIYQINEDDLLYYGTQDFYGNAYYDYIISGFAYAPSAISSEVSFFRLGVDVYYYQGESSDEVVKHFYYDFLPGIDGVQFTSGAFSTKFRPTDPNDTNKYNCVSAIDIYCEYTNQPNGNAWFDNISVIHADLNNYAGYYYYSEGSSKGLLAATECPSYSEYYVYDENKNLTAVATSNGNLTIYEYSDVFVHQLDSVIQCEYSYDGVYFLPLDEEDPLSLVTKYYKIRTDYEYDTYGNTTEITTTPIKSDNGEAISGAKKTHSAFTYDTSDTSSVMFGALLSETDSTGATVYYYYDSDTCRLDATANSASGNGLVYSYNNKGQLVTVIPALYVSPSSYSGVTNAERVEYTYGTDNMLTEISTNSTSYAFSYDEFGNRVWVKAGDNTLASYEYAENNGKLVKTTYGNGFSVEYVYNSLEMLEEVWYTDSEGTKTKAYEYVYTSDGLLQSVKDNVNGKQTVYTYDCQNRTSRIVNSSDDDMYNDLFTDRAFYDNGNLQYIQTYIDLIDGTDYDNTTMLSFCYYDTNSNMLITYLIGPSYAGGGISFTYDDLYRISGESFTLESFNADYSFTYKNYGEYTTGLVESVTTVINETETKSETYTYDAEGNITKITYSNGQEVRYYYDDLGQIVREDNTLLTLTYTYTYDNAGNITGKNIYQITSAGTEPTALLQSLTYTYSSSDWGDLLTSYNGHTITYDNIGNPIDYYNGSSYTFGWEGRRLVSATKGASSMSFAYNDEGIRLSKTVNGVVTEYFYQGSMLVAEKTNSQIIVYHYDENGAPVGFMYWDENHAKQDWDVYAFEKNIQGDVIAVYDASTGVKLISYRYNAWGDPSAIYHNSGDSTTAVKNPYRYRGYYYDSDLDLYYLKSRYYDANTCRFISPDSLMSGVNGSLHGLNLYVYCFNNPLSYTDSEGNWPEWIERKRQEAKEKWNNVVKNVEDLWNVVTGWVEEKTNRIEGTSSAGLTASVTYKNVTVSAQLGNSYDENGEKDLQLSVFCGASSSSNGFFIGGYYSETSAKEVGDLKGPFDQVGGSFGTHMLGLPLILCIDTLTMQNPKKQEMYIGSTMSIGVGSPGAEIHKGKGFTFSISDFINYIVSIGGT